jgi:hypothetical protein
VTNKIVSVKTRRLKKLHGQYRAWQDRYIYDYEIVAVHLSGIPALIPIARGSFGRWYPKFSLRPTEFMFEDPHGHIHCGPLSSITSWIVAEHHCKGCNDDDFHRVLEEAGEADGS